MPLITLREVSLAFGGPPLLDHVQLAIDKGERLCLVGRNGTGKSTLLKLVVGELRADDGELVLQQGIRIARLAQEVPPALHGSIYDVVAGGVEALGPLLAEHHELTHRLANGEEGLLDRLDRVQREIEVAGGWELDQRVEALLSRMGLTGDLPFAGLSGGMKRRVMLARALVTEPDLLLLDEPTNHLDIDGIRWLEERLLAWGGALLFITHDRAFLRRLATRIIELDRGRLSSWPGNYDQYLERKQQALEAEAAENARFDKRLADEEVWIRQGIKARRTRNEGRVRSLVAMRRERADRRERMGRARFEIGGAEASGKVVIDAQNLSYDWGEQPIVRDLTTTIIRGDKVGIIGPNGTGKTTLIKLLLGEIPPRNGSVKLGARVEVAYFDQLRAALDEEKSVRDNVSEGSDQVTVNGHSRHVMSYLADFLFPSQRANTPVKALSGGERNRLLLAKLFTRPANLLVLDEPTNDLDVESLELLESLLVEYEGTVLLVSHDRAFLDNVVTSTLVFEGDGRVAEYVGGYEEWLRQRPPPPTPSLPTAPAKPSAPAAPSSAPAEAAKKGRKLSYKEQRELEALPGRIEQLETEQTQLQAQLGDPELYRQGGDGVATTQARLATIEAELTTAYARWEALDS